MKSTGKLCKILCICCQTNEVGNSEIICENCWRYLMPKKHWQGAKLEWGDIWVILCHWHALHDVDDKDYEFVHKIILLCYQHEGS